MAERVHIRHILLKTVDKPKDELPKLAAKAGGSLIPGGSLLGLIGDGPDLYGALTHDPKDWLDVALKATACTPAIMVVERAFGLLDAS